MDARVDSRIPVDVKEKASKELAAHGLSISSFIRMTLSSVANRSEERRVGKECRSRWSPYH